MLSGRSSIFVGFPVMRSMSPGFLDRNSIVKLYVVTPVNAVLCHGLFIRMVKSVVPVVLFDPDFPKRRYPTTTQ